MAGYFNNFPKTQYQLLNKIDSEIITNIFVKFKIREEIKNNAAMYFKYSIRDGDTPESIANNIYGTPHAFWLIYHLNDWLSLYKNFPMTETELVEYVSKKYTNPNAIHHYEDGLKNWVNSTYPLATFISNFDYERDINESKRNIKILDPQYYGILQRELEQELLKANG